MSIISDQVSEKIKQSQDSHKKLVKTLSKETKNLQDSADKKVDIVNYYNSLSDRDKYAFNQELKRKKVRESYAQYLKYVYGSNYTLTNFHKFLAKVCETVVKRIEEGKNTKICLSVPPQHGKGYPIDFPILTTKGWKNHGDLKVGDFVYSDNGNPVPVLGNQKPYYHKCLKVTFQNGEEHIVTREHLWKVYVEVEHRENGKHKNKRVPMILETQEIMQNLSKYRRSPYVLINSPIQNDKKELPIDPYTLGLWLGDGTSANSEIVVADTDLPFELNGIGNNENYSVVKKKGYKNLSFIVLGKEQTKKTRNSYKNDFRKRIHDINLCKNKHIPTQYLLASEEQRWELLRGLMDTDGCCDKNGSCEFTNINKELAYNVYTLLHSLGIKARIGEYNATLYGKYISKKYRVIFTPNKENIIFKIPRKQERVFNKLKKDREDKYKYFIKHIVPVEDKLVSCISVEGGIYLAGKELIPTHNSMTITETLPSWFMGRNPDSRCICTGYNADMAEKFGDRNREKVKKFGKEIFGIEVSESQDNKTLFNLKDHLGGLYSAGITGGLTGNQGALIIIDDPFKNGIEAKNQSVRDNIWQIFCDSILTRQRGLGNAIIVIHTRWHEDDLIGRIMKTDKNSEWLIINIPCVAEENDRYLHRKVGETLCPELGFDAKWVENMRTTLGKANFNALYQGKPFIEGGNIVKRQDIMFYSKNTCPVDFEEYVLSCDLSFGTTTKSSDPYCMTLWGRNGGNHYLLKILDKKASFTETNRTLRVLCSEYPKLKKKIIEAKANGNATIELLGREIGGFVPFDPKGESKEARFNAVSPYFEAHNVFFPDETVEPNIENYIEMVLKFPNITHEDFIDTISQYLLNYEYKYGGKINTDSRFSILAKAIRGF